MVAAKRFDFKPFSCAGLAALALVCVAPPATALPTSAPGASMAVSLPQAPVPKHSVVSFVGRASQIKVRAGQAVATPCFQTVAALDGVAAIDGCRLELASQSLGPGAKPDAPYFTAEGLSDDSPTSDAAVDEVLSALDAANRRYLQQVPAPLARAQAARGRYAQVGGDPYLGTTRVTILGLDGRMMTWGSDSPAGPERLVEVIAPIPADRYEWDGKRVNMLLLTGHPAGYEPRAFATALANFRMS